ncbi:hypothetical protein BO70DRAFT_133342 [Aspergillus heteromorphus CBS 117.55]|uniref:Uncharacterized protein n=1 Tax=Aspergillus heteromorphus CBS 117.55 TaxID=1448321 RepID=A0A317WW02_9EURO|nr:uncharacterized protein BO70DRAFT_133342 [Aspergillus heteromorphus CBS 117.55]PWY90051.1 hypothetical protein BO70DRAFT_133342 [Aspergillus heteromorphus CBS 117.55]
MLNTVSYTAHCTLHPVHCTPELNHAWISSRPFFTSRPSLFSCCHETSSSPPSSSLACRGDPFRDVVLVPSSGSLISALLKCLLTTERTIHPSLSIQPVETCIALFGADYNTIIPSFPSLLSLSTPEADRSACLSSTDPSGPRVWNFLRSPGRNIRLQQQALRKFSPVPLIAVAGPVSALSALPACPPPASLAVVSLRNFPPRTSNFNFAPPPPRLLRL